MKSKRRRWFWLGCVGLNLLVVLATILWLLTAYMGWNERKTSQECEPYRDEDSENRPDQCNFDLEDVAYIGVMVAALAVTAVLGLGLALWLLIGAVAWLLARRFRRVEADAYRSDLMG
jgi:uncharacterized iron-regulated membrane protein